MLMACLAATLPVAAQAAPQAEIAIRWDPSQGGPAELHDAFAALGLTHAAPQAFLVQYHAASQPDHAPPGFGAVLRERSSGQASDTTYKLRGPAPAPDAFVGGWTCPLVGKAVVKYEIDLSWTGDATPRRAYSLSCTVGAPAAMAVPDGRLGAAAVRCSNRMERIHSGNVKAERWTFADGLQIIEVSLGNTRDNAAALEDFRRRIVAPLLERGVRPLPDSKTELGSAC